jgi:hypothetical protein
MPTYLNAYLPKLSIMASLRDSKEGKKAKPGSTLFDEVRPSVIFSGLQLQLSYTPASGRKPLMQPALVLGPPAVGRSRFGVNQPKGGRGAAHQRWSGTH